MVRLPRLQLVPLALLLVLLAGFSLQPRPAVARPVAQKEIPHAIEGKEDCLLCHKSAVKPIPASHATYDSKMCLACHKVAAPGAPPAQATAAPTAPAQATTVPAAPAATAQPPAQPTKAPVAPIGATATTAPAVPGVPKLVPHPLEGRAACSTCHGIAGAKPYPKDHIGRPDSGCLQCHVPVGSTKIPTPGVPSGLPAGADSCLACHRQTDMTMTLSGGQKLSLFVDGEQFAVSVHAKQGLTCVACHPTNSVFPHPAVKAASSRELNRGIIQQACATCHKTIYDQYKDSVHGKALLQENNLDVPACTDCHGKHNITDPRPEMSPLFRLNSPDLCSSCHANAQLMGKYGISTNVAKSYLNDFHGASVRLQKDKDPNINSYKAVCYDCHGIHDIKLTNDPASAVIKANLVKTCQKCHPDADANFPTAWTSHYTPNLQKWPLVYFVNLFYSIVIPVTIGGMVTFIGLDIARTMVNKKSQESEMSVTAEAHSSDETFVRFATSQRLEHVLLLISFSILGFTGLIQKFNQISVVENLIFGLGGIDTVRLIHRTFALILVIECVYHAVALAYQFLTKRSRPTMLPTPHDLVDAWQMVLYFLGRSKERPLFDHFDFRQKFEYWAMVWGTIVMAITGFAMWFPIQTTTFLSGEVIPAAKAAHGAEAILAVLSIIIWHMYHAHLSAEVFPVDTSIFKGKISTERMLHEHPLEYARIMEERKNALLAQAAATEDVAVDTSAKT